MTKRFLRLLMTGGSIIAATATATALQNSINIYVSASSTGGDGSSAKPLGDLESALEKIKEIRTNNPTQATDVNIIIKEGVYRLNETLTLHSDIFGKGAGKTVSAPLMARMCQ